MGNLKDTRLTSGQSLPAPNIILVECTDASIFEIAEDRG